MSEAADEIRSRRGAVRAGAGAVAGFLVFAIGAASGWYASSQGGGAGGAHGPHEAEHAAHALDRRTLENLGVAVAEAAPGEFVRTREIPAVVTLVPARRRPAHAPVAGVVARVLVEEGVRVAPGEPVAEILRDPLPRPSLPLTESLLRPINEELHEALASLRTAAKAASIAAEELQRVRGMLGGAGGATLPGKVEIDLVYEEARARVALANAREDAWRHGLTAGEVDAVERGEDPPADAALMKRALERAQMWTPRTEAIFAALPPESHSSRLHVALLGELTAGQLLPEGLAELLRSNPPLGASMAEVGGLLQAGATLDRIASLHEAGGFRATVAVRAPGGDADWDVAAVHAKPGAHVEAGAPIADLVDRSVVHLRMAPAGPDLAALASALRSNETLEAEPLVPGSGPVLLGLPILQLVAPESEATHGAAIAPAANEPLPAAAGSRFRSWKLREGLRYLVRVPVERLPGRFVLPSESVFPRGAASMVLLEDGESFRAVAVRIEHRDSRVAVIAADGAIFPGDRVVTRGAYALSLALLAEPAGGGGHAGHVH